MKNPQILEDISRKIKELVQNSPLQDIETNIHALLQGAFTKLALVSKDEFDVQADLLRLTREKLEKIQAQLDALENSTQNPL
jgi:ubiquinone biosynthesis accessory factor UbiK